MKTIIVVYSAKQLSSKDAGRMKKYSFNTESDVKEGDIIEAKEYDTPLLVVKVMDKSFKYYNASNGELSDNYNSTAQWVIRRLEIRDDEEEVIYGSIKRDVSSPIK